MRAGRGTGKRIPHLEIRLARVAASHEGHAHTARGVGEAVASLAEGTLRRQRARHAGAVIRLGREVVRAIYSSSCSCFYWFSCCIIREGEGAVPSLKGRQCRCAVRWCRWERRSSCTCKTCRDRAHSKSEIISQRTQGTEKNLERSENNTSFTSAANSRRQAIVLRSVELYTQASPGAQICKDKQ
jgi:hypothetical protein